MCLRGKEIWVHAMIRIEDLDKLPPEIIISLGEMS